MRYGRLVLAALVVCLLMALGRSARADEISGSASDPAPAVVYRAPFRARSAPDRYVPAAMVPENRAGILAPLVPPTPFVLTQGEALTPRRGYVGVTLQRVDDERQMFDKFGNRYTSDGEVQIVTAEWVSPALRLRLGTLPMRVHLGASLNTYTLETAIYDGLRNWVERDLFSSDPATLGHFVGGKALEVDTASGKHIELLDGSPLFKATVTGKVDLPCIPLFRTHIDNALSVGVTPPAFGSHRRTANDGFQFDATWAFGVPFGRHFRVTGAAAVLLPGSSPIFDDLGLQHQSVIFTGHGDLTWWFTRWIAFGIGASWHSHYLQDTGLPMDLSSTYVNAQFLIRVKRHATLYVIFSENPEPNIETIPGSNFSASQKESDFNVSLGLRWSF